MNYLSIKILFCQEYIYTVIKRATTQGRPYEKQEHPCLSVGVALCGDPRDGTLRVASPTNVNSINATFVCVKLI